MAYPTRQQVVQSFSMCVDDPNQRIFTDTPPSTGGPSLIQWALDCAYEALYNACYSYEIPRITDIIDGIAVPPGTTSLTPQQMISPSYPTGIANFSQYEWLTERQYGSQDRFIDLTPVDRLAQRAPTDKLKEFVWRNDTFYFIGATTLIELKMEFESSGTAPTSAGGQVLIDSCGQFLAYYMASMALPLKGKSQQATMYKNMAVGARYDAGEIGGELWRIIQPRVRQRQKVPISKKPYTANRRLMVRMPGPYVAAQQGTTGGGAQNVPIQFTTANGTIVGLIDGTNTVFTLITGGVTYLSVYRNGDLQTFGVDYTAVNNQITFTAANVPQPGDLITAEAFVSYALPGENPAISGYNIGGYNQGGFGG